MKVREWLESRMGTTIELAPDFILADALDPILDAEVIRGTTADAVWVIEPGAMEAALAAMLEQTRAELADEVVHRDEDSGLTITLGQEQADATFDYNAAILRRALQALLPGARVADEVLPAGSVTRIEYRDGGYSRGDKMPAYAILADTREEAGE